MLIGHQTRTTGNQPHAGCTISTMPSSMEAADLRKQSHFPHVRANELHSIVSAMCDGIFIVACAQFVLGEAVRHVQYTDSSSARQLASREGCGRLRHVSGKILWVQQKTNDKSVLLKQVPTIWNLECCRHRHKMFAAETFVLSYARNWIGLPGHV